jgi:hypothetical protein
MNEQEMLGCYFKTVKGLLKAENELDAFNIFQLKNIRCINTAHDNWNGGIDYYQVEILISPSEFGKLKKEAKIEKIETIISSAFNNAIKGDESVVLNEIIIVPSASVEDNMPDIETTDDFSYWDFGYYKMFISHLTKDKQSASNLKKALSDYGVSCFVAHEDIEPTKLWANEIENALRTMQCLCAVITPEFNNSKWCDQEVGYALGRQILVIPIRKECDPYGLFGKIQGLQSKGKTANILAQEIFQILYSNPLSQRTFVKNLAELFLNSKSNIDANKWIEHLNNIISIDYEIVEFIHSNYLANDNLKENAVLEKANKLFDKYSLKHLTAEPIVENNTELGDLPF